MHPCSWSWRRLETALLLPLARSYFTILMGTMHAWVRVGKGRREVAVTSIQHACILSRIKAECLLPMAVHHVCVSPVGHCCFCCFCLVLSWFDTLDRYCEHASSGTVVSRSGADYWLLQVLDVLREVAFEAEFLSTRIEKERRAIQAEAQMMNTIEYRVDCQLLQYLHEENALGFRFPIGKMDQVSQCFVTCCHKRAAFSYSLLGMQSCYGYNKSHSTHADLQSQVPLTSFPCNPQF